MNYLIGCFPIKKAFFSCLKSAWSLITILFLFGLNTSADAQSLDIRNIKDIFRPNVRLTSEFLPPRSLKVSDLNTMQDTVQYGTLTIGGQMSIPIKGKIELGLKLDKLKNFKNIRKWSDLKDVIPVNLEAYQIFLMLQGGIRRTDLTFDPEAHRQYYLGAGIMGLHLQRKFRLLFYQANLRISEDGGTLDKLTPGFDGLIGQARLYKYGFFYYYGAYINYMNGRLFPVPFVGATFALPPFFSVQIILPFQAKITYRKHKKLRAGLAFTLGSFQSSFENRTGAWGFPLTEETKRLGMSELHLKITTTTEYKAGEKGRLVVEVGTVLGRSFSFRASGYDDAISYHPGIAPYISVGYQANLSTGKSLFRNIIERLRLDF